MQMDNYTIWIYIFRKNIVLMNIHTPYMYVYETCKKIIYHLPNILHVLYRYNKTIQVRFSLQPLPTYYTEQYLMNFQSMSNFHTKRNFLSKRIIIIIIRDLVIYTHFLSEHSSSLPQVSSHHSKSFSRLMESSVPVRCYPSTTDFQPRCGFRQDWYGRTPPLVYVQVGSRQVPCSLVRWTVGSPELTEFCGAPPSRPPLAALLQ